MTQRWGITVPFEGVPLAEHRDWYRELVDLGYTDVWSAEAMGSDGFTPLALAAAWAPELRLGTAIIPSFTRGPALLAQSAASLAEAAPGRFVFGLGTSSQVIVESWNAVPFEHPLGHTRDMIRFCREAFAGDKVSGEFGGKTVRGFRLGVGTATPPPIYLAALREQMLRLAGREADGVIINWLSAGDVAKVVGVARGAAHEVGRTMDDVVARIFVAPTADRDTVMKLGRYAIAAYLNVEVYARFHEWLGRGEMLTPMWEKWKAGDRPGALAAIPDELVDELIIWGRPEVCRDKIEAYVDGGVTTPVIALLPFGYDQRTAVRDLSPLFR